MQSIDKDVLLRDKEFQEIVASFRPLCLHKPEDQQSLGRIDSEKVMVSFGSGKFETVSFEDVLFIVSPKDFKMEVDRASVASMEYLNYLFGRIGRSVARFICVFCDEIRKCICDDDKLQTIAK